MSDAGQSRFGSVRAWWSRRGKFSKVAIIVVAVIVVAVRRQMEGWTMRYRPFVAVLGLAVLALLIPSATESTTLPGMADVSKAYAGAADGMSRARTARPRTATNGRYLIVQPSIWRLTATTITATTIIATLENLPRLLHQARALPNLDWPVLLTTFPSVVFSSRWSL